VQSEGEAKGATFVLLFPLKHENEVAEVITVDETELPEVKDLT